MVTFDSTSPRTRVAAAFVTAISMLAALASGECTAQQSPSTSLPEAVQPYLNARTAIVGWIDISRVDPEAMAVFSEKLSRPWQNPIQLKGTRDALLQLGVARVYWISDLSGLAIGPQALIVPASAEKRDAVARILTATAEDTHGTAMIDGGAVLVGNMETIRQLREQKTGLPNPDLLTAISRIQDPHGLVVLTPAEALLPLVGILPEFLGADDPRAGQAAEVLVNLRSVTFSGQLPPSSAMLRITTRSAKVAQGLTALSNEWIKEILGEDAQAVRLTADGDSAVLNVDSVDHAMAVTAAVHELSGGNRRRNTADALKQIALAMHNFHDVYGHFPPQALVDGQGGRLLSWRVLILPWLEESALYNEFHLDEPWDSEHNSKLIPRMPDVFRAQTFLRDTLEPGRTRFVAPLTLTSTFGRPGGGVRIQEITDGTSNTLLVVEASADKAVIWTKPEDLSVSSEDPLLSIINRDAEGFWAGMCDGSVHFLSGKLDAGTLRALMSINGADTVDLGKVVD